MKPICVRFSALALLLAVTGCAASYGQTYHQTYVHTYVRPSMSPAGEIGISYFYDNLSPYGEWIQEPSLGWCWTPYNVASDWRPYYDGHWEYTDYGWSWASNEPWGWATYHYGRWLFDDSYGWVWVPGTDWAPAWVAWRYSDDCVGWAPLPPSAGWNSAGLAFEDVDAIPVHEWCFVPQAHVLDVNIRVQVTSVARNVTLFERSRDMTRFEVRDGRPANVGLDVAQVERIVRRPVPRVKIVDVDAPARGSGQPLGKGTIAFFRPTIRPMPSQPAPAPVVAEQRKFIPEDVLQRQRDEQQRRLENDLNVERGRLARDQQNELRAQAPGAEVDAIRKRHVAEQQAFEAHATRQRQVLAQRFQKQILKPAKTKYAGKPEDQDQNKDKGARHAGGGQ